MRFKLFLLITLVSLLLISGVIEAKEIKGQVVAINAAKESLLLKTKQGVIEYKLSFDPQISLNNKSVSLSALRPIDYKSFCEAKLKLNPNNRIINIEAAYKAIEVVVTKLKKKNLIVKKLATGIVRQFKIAEDIEISRNNLKVAAKELVPGDKGLIILGLNNKIKKVIIHNYQVYGFLKEINTHNREIIVNTGSRQKPSYNTFNIPKEATIKLSQQKVAFNWLKSDFWVKLEFSRGLKNIIVKKI